MHDHKRKSFLSWAVFPFLLASPLLTQAQQQPEALQQKLQLMQEATAKNAQQLHTYQWIESSTITLNGSTKPPRRSICRYAPDGTVTKTPLEQDQTPRPRGGLIMRAVEKKKIDDVREDVQQVQALTRMYLPFKQESLREAFQTNKVALEHDGANGETTLVVHDYVKPGDELRLTLNPSTMQVQRIGIKTYFEKPKEVLTADVQFSSLPDGTAYPSLNTIEAPSKKISITTGSTDFSKVAY